MKFPIQKISPAVWTVAGSDSGGCAGIQADLKTMQALGVHACSVVTAVTAQNPKEIIGIERISDAMISAQLTALKAEFSPAAVKTGMLASPASIVSLAELLGQLKPFVICDPVMVASSGKTLMEPSSFKAMKESLFPLVDLLTPNLPEAERLLERTISTPEEVEKAATDLLALGVKQVLLKGGHAMNDFAQDYWTDGVRGVWLSSHRRMAFRPHGTGCTLASAIAACRAQGLPTLDAICLAKAFVNRALRLAFRAAGGSHVLYSATWPMEVSPDDMPWLMEAPLERNRAEKFPDCGPHKLGFYPIVDRAAWLARLLPQGVSTIQLRIKDLRGEELENEIKQAVAMARASGCRLFVNDHWELALKHGAYGVHLGQGDLASADLEKLRRGGLRLGISTHSYAEVARAHAIRPSYVAIGPIFSTTTKLMPYAPQGIEALKRWRQLLDYPLVAIGGITLDRGLEVAAAGAEGISVMADVSRSEQPEERTRAWVQQLAPL